jgi:3-oxoacyl-[acyl-carrier-protein] synthase-3
MDQIDCVISTHYPDHNDPGTGVFFAGQARDRSDSGVRDQEQCCGLIFGVPWPTILCGSEPIGTCLFVCSEVLSKRIDGSYDGRNISILFGDGAGAVVVGPCDVPAEVSGSFPLFDGNQGKDPFYGSSGYGAW